MKKNDPKNQQSSRNFEEQGLNEVSQQIMDAYNSGFMGESETSQDLVEVLETDEV
ncbi:hypothetical protein RCG23_17620 [Neobacillus sp. PS3-34]|uniref:hypothetical protein n=1 Tax=Neobacillus sp. PS3-34 TaxID=3070678 RepID=UPI0027E1A5F9|nr:hypothetical protein [Neobacillus sp. PS3-34]WML47300.1 hypothetical protein RCG23_17620 [Neobacillus sp. PS3-34]